MSELILPRRRFLLSAASRVATPAVIRVAKLMPIKVNSLDRKMWRISYVDCWPEEPTFESFTSRSETLAWGTEKEISAYVRQGNTSRLRVFAKEIRAEKHTVSVLLPRTEISL